MESEGGLQTGPGPGGMVRMGSSVDTLVHLTPAKGQGPAGRDTGMNQQRLLWIMPSQLPPAVVPSGKPGACQDQLSSPEGSEAADR